ncbi:stage V sporulation protein AC [Anaeromicropila herbilytica]|uniref:Stage V sporulation protein AC n=1 Tax=Anaeromicropila herbilytica TaxID=2785025 RepID=A0A7R7EKA8_9FIRM|nr:stage V sporulation protein AC [Anaeromicropila herbilytica]BCN30032.1 stage V sporulation protein AC [Anaeromicropila herbilytica]
MSEDEKKQSTMKDVINEKNQSLRDQKYNEYVEKVTPKHSWFINMCYAFFVGGIICTIGQIFTNLYISYGADKEKAALFTVVTLVFLSVVLTGFGIYPKLAKFGGAGTIVPITGFANSVAAPAIEFKREGQVFGIGCKIFTIAGPVILYGIFSSWLLGILYLILNWSKIM